MNLIECNQQRMNFEQYDVGGKLANLGNYTEFVKVLKDKYNNSGCGKDPLMEKCLERDLYIRNLQNTITQKNQQNNIPQASAWTKVLAEETKKFNDLGCSGKIQEARGAVVEEKLSKYNALDKERIEAESKYQENKKIFIGASVLLITVALIVVIKSK